MDDVIFEEFKGTGNMELKLDRTLQERRIFPAIDVLKSGTRREEDLLSPEETDAVWTIRREFGSRSNTETMSAIINYMKNTDNNEMFSKIISKSYGK